MARIVLITGGGRSGKSEYAQKLAEALPGRRVFIAPCPVIDDEMRERIEKHRQARSLSDWDTIEETVDLAGALKGASRYNVILVDCLTLWVNNLMYEAEGELKEVTEEEITRRCEALISVCREISGTVIFVTNEVGMGIVPDNPAARRFRELAGRCNQLVATVADEVALMTCGIPLMLKQRDPS